MKGFEVTQFPKLCLVASMLVLAGCVTYPTGPSVMALPGSRMSFDQFRSDDVECRLYASQSSGGDAQQSAQLSGATSAALGTVVGAAAGAALGGSSEAAAWGAGAGLLFGSVAGAGAADASAWSMQQRYDAGYTQCMYAKGHKVPVAGNYTSSPRSRPAYGPPPSRGQSAPSSSGGTYAPPPAPGTYAPPPAPGTYSPPPAPGTYAPPPASGVPPAAGS